MFHAKCAIWLENARAALISQCSKEVCMGIFEIIAGAFIVTVPALVLADVLEPHRTDTGK
jgi:hypothetical protein